MTNDDTHAFTAQIMHILRAHYGSYAEAVYDSSALLRYLNKKTRAANRGAKSRGAYANHYALYVLVEHYIAGEFDEERNWGRYLAAKGARFSDLFRRQRELPFGSKLQNHALNSRLNDEFRKFFPEIGQVPIVRDTTNQRYWANEELLIVDIGDEDYELTKFNIARAVIDIIDTYVESRRADFESFIEHCKSLSVSSDGDIKETTEFVLECLRPDSDARTFEIVTFAILKAFYYDQVVWMRTPEQVASEERLMLYKTGRTNANDGGIDFVMKPLGRFFQVTETPDAGKYFLDIDKVQHYPITFVVKSHDSAETIYNRIVADAEVRFADDAVVDRYRRAIEEIINIPQLQEYLDEVRAKGRLDMLLDEIVLYSRLEFGIDSPA